MAKYALVNPDNSIVEFRFYDTPPEANTTNMAKPRLLPVVLQDVTFDSISEVHVGPAYTVRTMDVLEEWTKRAKTAGEVDAMRDNKISEVNYQADLHLEHNVQQQCRSLSRLVNLLYRHTDITGWPAAQQASVAEHQAKLDDIDNVRQIEAVKVAEVEALVTPQEIAAYDATAGWEAVSP